MPAHVNHSDYFKKLRIVIGLIVMVCVGGTISLFIRHRASIPSIEPKDILGRQSTSQRLEFRGFRYDGNLGGKRVISIKADRFSIEKKKLGFLRFGLMNVALFENAFIRIYGDKPDESHENSKQKLSFKGSFSKETLPSFPVKRISSIVMEPIDVELHDEHSAVTRISAASATLGLRKRIIVFKGDVRVVSEDRVLTADRLNLLLETAVIKTGGNFLLKAPGKQREGHRLTTDIFLRPVSSYDKYQFQKGVLNNE
jgi:hypothetical protein